MNSQKRSIKDLFRIAKGQKSGCCTKEESKNTCCQPQKKNDECCEDHVKQQSCCQ